MDQKQIVKQMMDFNKTTFDNTFSAIVGTQDQAEKLVSRFLEKAPWFPEEGKKAVDEWVKAYKKSREDFKNAYDKGFEKVADYFAAFQNEMGAKSDKK